MKFEDTALEPPEPGEPPVARGDEPPVAPVPGPLPPVPLAEAPPTTDPPAPPTAAETDPPWPICVDAVPPPSELPQEIVRAPKNRQNCTLRDVVYRKRIVFLSSNGICGCAW